MTATQTRREPKWWDAQPEPVRAILDLADDADDTRTARILRSFGAAEHIGAVKSLADDLVMIERLGFDDPFLVLADYLDAPYRGLGCAADRCDEIAAELRADVLTRAQLVASLIAQHGATLASA